METEKSYSTIERIMFFLTPILFTLVLLGVLLTLFNIDLRNKALEIGNKVPLLERVLPDPKAEGTSAPANTDDTIRNQNAASKIAELEQLIAEKEAELSQRSAEAVSQRQLAEELQAELDRLKEESAGKQLDDQEYQNRISSLAAMFGQIAPSKAAPILQSMTLEEMVLIMDAMRTEARVAVMEKMLPARAAEAAVMLKDAVPVKDRQIAALQSRLNVKEAAEPAKNQFLDEAQLAGTFGTMPADSAAKLLLQMAEVSPAKVLQVLNAVNDTQRSGILAEMSKQNQKYTAQLVTKLMQGK